MMPTAKVCLSTRELSMTQSTGFFFRAFLGKCFNSEQKPNFTSHWLSLKSRSINNMCRMSTISIPMPSHSQSSALMTTLWISVLNLLRQMPDIRELKNSLGKVFLKWGCSKCMPLKHLFISIWWSQYQDFSAKNRTRAKIGSIWKITANSITCHCSRFVGRLNQPLMLEKS